MLSYIQVSNQLRHTLHTDSLQKSTPKADIAFKTEEKLEAENVGNFKNSVKLYFRVNIFPKFGATDSETYVVT